MKLRSFGLPEHVGLAGAVILRCFGLVVVAHFLAAVFEPGQRQRDCMLAEVAVLSRRAGAVVVQLVVAIREFDVVRVGACDRGADRVAVLVDRADGANGVKGEVWRWHVG